VALVLAPSVVGLVAVIVMPASVLTSTSAMLSASDVYGPAALVPLPEASVCSVPTL